jgi:CBS domain containing-hemolysin-like protein
VGGLARVGGGAVPKVGEVVEHGPLRIEILSADDYRVDQVRISLTDPNEEEKEST